MILPSSGLSLALIDTIENLLALIGTDLEAARADGLKLLAIWLGSFIIWRVVKVLSNRVVVMADDGDDDLLSHGEKRAETVAGLLQGVGKLVILVFALILSLDVFMDIGPLLAGAGVIGLAVSFGAQSMVKDFIAGFFILMENQFDVGDVITAAGSSGVVEKMTMRVVMLRDIRGTLHVIPNGQIATVSNQTRGWARSVLDIGVGYDADIDQAIAVMRDEMERFTADQKWQPKLDGQSDVVGVQELGDSAVSIRVMLRTIPGSQWEVGREFLRRAKIRLDSEGIDIPFPQRTVHLRQAGPGAAEQSQ